MYHAIQHPFDYWNSFYWIIAFVVSWLAFSSKVQQVRTKTMQLVFVASLLRTVRIKEKEQTLFDSERTFVSCLTRRGHL